jgi:acetyl-CoA C-acetyltransferase
MRPTTTMQSLAQLQPSFVDGPDGTDAVAIGIRKSRRSITTMPATPGHRRRRGRGTVGNKEAGAKHGLRPWAKTAPRQYRLEPAS